MSSRPEGPLARAPRLLVSFILWAVPKVGYVTIYYSLTILTQIAINATESSSFNTMIIKYLQMSVFLLMTETGFFDNKGRSVCELRVHRQREQVIAASCPEFEGSTESACSTALLCCF